MAGKYEKKTENGTHAKRSAPKVWGILRGIFTWLLVIAAVAMMVFTIISVTTFDRNDRDLFGFKAYIVRSDSMSATDFSAGDLILVKEVDPSTLKEGDIVSYTSTNTENFGETVTHKIRSVTTDENGNPGFITYGTTTNTDDDNIVTYGHVLGKYVGHLPGVGTFFSFLKTPPGYICCILLPFLLLILFQGVNSVRLFRRYKAEQMAELEEQRKAERAELDAERERLEQERKRSEEMMAELIKMKATMEGMGGKSATSSEQE